MAVCAELALQLRLTYLGGGIRRVHTVQFIV
jgi:hypothetical protein